MANGSNTGRVRDARAEGDGIYIARTIVLKFDITLNGCTRTGRRSKKI